LPGGEIVEAGLDLRLDIALEQFSQAIGRRPVPADLG
jgi:hypothetical protein